jgi:hypothetical protein
MFKILEYYLKIAPNKHSLASQDSTQAGFAMPLALGMGLVMIIVAASMIGRSQSDRIVTNSQRETGRALSVAEAGVVRVQSFLDRYKILANQDLDQWSKILKKSSPVLTSCKSINLKLLKQQAELFKQKTWINLDDKNPSKGRYQIIDYQYDNGIEGIGKLTIAGAIDPFNTTQNTAQSTLAVEIPIGSELAKMAPPALWANTFTLNPNQKITGEIRSNDCPQLASLDADGVLGVELSNIAIVKDLASGQIIADPFTSIPIAKKPPATATSLPAITSSIKFPRPNSVDVPDAKGEYHYVVDIDNPSSGYSIKLKDLDKIELDLAADQKVNLYLKGNLDLAGSQTINVNAIHPNLRIYGSAQTLKLIVKDTAVITALIHTPFAIASSISASPANPNSNITGAAWVKSWDSATSPNQLPIVQAGTWADFGITKPAQPAQLNPISAWQRVDH